MRTSVTIRPPADLMPFWDQIVEGWQAFFDDKELSANPYKQDDAHKAWRYGYLDAMDYGN